MRAVRWVDGQAAEIDLRWVRRPGLWALLGVLVRRAKEVLGGRPAGATAERLALALRALMQAGDAADGQGRPIAPNYFRLHLEERVRAKLSSRAKWLNDELGEALERWSDELGREPIGRWDLRLNGAGGRKLAAHAVFIRFDFVENRQLPPVKKDEVRLRPMTRRVLAMLDGEPSPAPAAPPPRPPPKTRRAEVEGEPPGSILASWGTGKRERVVMHPKKVYQLGRSHRDAPSVGFVALVGAPMEVDPIHCSVENSGSMVRIKRTSTAPPVRVAGTTIDPGDTLAIKVPADLILGDEACVVHLDWA